MSKELDSMLDQVAHQGHTVPKRRLTDEELEAKYTATSLLAENSLARSMNIYHLSKKKHI